MAGEKPAHRKTEVSRATLIVPGLVGPKAYPKGEVDGHLVNIPELAYVCPSDAFFSSFHAMDMFEMGDRVTRKGSKLSVRDPYRKPTQVVESSRLR